MGFPPNEKLFEIRYLRNPQRPSCPVLEARIRGREDLGKRSGFDMKREEFDSYLRLTWAFELSRFGMGA